MNKEELVQAVSSITSMSKNASLEAVDAVFEAIEESLIAHEDVTIAGFGTALCEAVYTVDKERLENYYCTLTADEMKLVDQAVLVSLGLTVPPTCTVDVSQSLEPEKVRVPLNEPFGLEDAYRVIKKERDTLLAQKEIYEKICAAALPRWPKDIEVGE